MSRVAGWDFWKGPVWVDDSPAAGSGGIGTSLKQDLASGEAHINSALSTAQSGVGVANAGAAAMKGDAQSIRNQAQLVNTQAGKVNASADALAALIPQYDPYRKELEGLGDQLAGIGTSLAGQANDVFGQGGALVNLDPSKGGLSKAYIDILNQLSPDRLVSRAASDTQSAFQNVAGQQSRDLARRGVSAGSGAAQALRQQLNRALATALSGAKTNAYMQGLNERGKFLDQMTGAANTLYNMGVQTQSQSTAALGQAGNMQKSAADILTQQAATQQNVGQLQQAAGQLFGNAASLFGSAAGIEGNAAQLSLSALQNLQSAQQTAAQYYTTAAGLSLQDSRGGGGGGGVTVASGADAPDYWDQTGHSSTWWNNELSKADYKNMAQEAARYNMAVKSGKK